MYYEFIKIFVYFCVYTIVEDNLFSYNIKVSFIRKVALYTIFRKCTNHQFLIIIDDLFDPWICIMD